MMNKKAVMDDLFDFLFFIVMSLVLMLFMGFFIKDSLDRGEDTSLGRLSGFRFGEARVAHLTTLTKTEANLHVIEEQKSHLFNPATIGECKDYHTKLDCREDFMNLRTSPPFHTCVWDDTAWSCI